MGTRKNEEFENVLKEGLERNKDLMQRLADYDRQPYKYIWERLQEWLHKRYAFAYEYNEDDEYDGVVCDFIESVFQEIAELEAEVIGEHNLKDIDLPVDGDHLNVGR